MSGTLIAPSRPPHAVAHDAAPVHRLKIAISTPVIQRGKTGVAQYVFALVKSLLPMADKHEFVLYVLQEDLPLFEFAAEHMRLIPVAEKWRPAVKNILWHQMVLPKLLKKEGVDVLHVPSYRRMLGSQPCALVSTIHDLAPFRLSGKYDIARMLYGRIVVKFLARRQHEIIAVSTSTGHDIETFLGVPRNKPHVILNGLDHLRFNPGNISIATANVAQRWKLNVPNFLFVSRLEHPAKNHVRLINAFNLFKSRTNSPWQLALGGADWHGAEHIHEAARNSPWAGDIRFLGFVPDDALPDLYRAAGAMVYPSLFEGFGLPPVEAMACGCPVISSTRGALDEIVADAAEKVDPESEESIAAALFRLSTDRASREALITAGTENATRFNWDMNAAEVVKVYEKAFRDKRPIYP